MEDFNAQKEQATPLELGSFHEAEFIEYITHTFRCELEAGETYEINWKDEYSGIENNAADIRVSAQFEGEALFSLQDDGYQTTRTCSPQSAGTLLLSIVPASDNSYNFGSYAIRVQKVVITPLVIGEWYNGEFANYFPQHFSFPVEAGKMYELRTNEKQTGDRSKTGQIDISATIDNEMIIANPENLYTMPDYITASSNGFVYIKIRPEESYPTYLGTWAVRIKEVVPITLQDNEWTDGVSTDFSTHFFQMPLSAGETYEINWSHSYYGDSTQTGRIKASARYGETELFSDQENGYTITRTVTPQTDSLLIVSIKPYSINSSNFGTWGVRAKKVVPVTLTDNEWTEGESIDSSQQYFSIQVTAGEIYTINWQDSDSGDGSWSGQIRASAFCNGTTLFTEVSNGYTTTRTAIPDEDGLLIVAVKPYSTSTSYSGTWAIKVKKVEPVTLTDNVWTDGESIDLSPHYFTFPVTAGETYEINWDDAYNTDGDKEGKIYVTAMHNGESVFESKTEGYISTQSYTPASNGTMTIKLVAMSNDYNTYLGTWAIRVKKVKPTSLVDNVWADGEFIDYSLHHFSILLTAGDIYEINWLDNNIGDGTRTGLIKASAAFNGSNLFTDARNVHTTPQTLQPEEDGLLVITIKPEENHTYYLGTWAVRIKKVIPVNLTDNVWADSSINANEKHYYSFQATANTTYRIKWNDSYQGDGTKTCDIKVSANMGATTFFSYSVSGYTRGQTITPSENGTVVLSVQPFRSREGGTYSIQVAEE
jgi:hypothetical protein